MSELEVIDTAVQEVNALAVRDASKSELVATLKPIWGRISEYQAVSAGLIVANKTDADKAAELLKQIKSDKDASETALREFDSGLVDRLHKAHRGFTALIARFTDPLTAAHKTTKAKIAAWQEEEARKARELQAKLQAEADERARKQREAAEMEARRQREKEEAARREAEEIRRKAEQASAAERERLLKEAQAKEKAAAAAAAAAERKEEKADSVITPTITIQAQKTNIRVQKVWKVKSLNANVFIKAAAENPMLLGFIEIKTTAIERAKAANSMLTIPGVEFEQVTR